MEIRKGKEEEQYYSKIAKKHFGYTDEWFESILPPKAIVSSAGNILELPHYYDMVLYFVLYEKSRSSPKK